VHCRPTEAWLSGGTAACHVPMGPCAPQASAVSGDETHMTCAQELYRALGISLRYHRDAAAGLERVQARLQLTRSGGLTSPLATTESAAVAVSAELVLVG
jgi:hypothetical protein